MGDLSADLGPGRAQIGRKRVISGTKREGRGGLKNGLTHPAHFFAVLGVAKPSPKEAYGLTF